MSSTPLHFPIPDSQVWRGSSLDHAMGINANYYGHHSSSKTPIILPAAQAAMYASSGGQYLHPPAYQAHQGHAASLAPPHRYATSSPTPSTSSSSNSTLFSCPGSPAESFTSYNGSSPAASRDSSPFPSQPAPKSGGGAYPYASNGNQNSKKY